MRQYQLKLWIHLDILLCTRCCTLQPSHHTLHRWRVLQKLSEAVSTEQRSYRKLSVTYKSLRKKITNLFHQKPISYLRCPSTNLFISFQICHATRAYHTNSQSRTSSITEKLTYEVVIFQHVIAFLKILFSSTLFLLAYITILCGVLTPLLCCILYMMDSLILCPWKWKPLQENHW